MKIALCQMEVVAKRPDLNTARAMKMLDEAKANGAELIAFSEMVIPGYMVGDLWEDESFLMDCTEHSKALANYAMEQGVVLVMGTVSSYLGWYGTGTSIKYNDGRISKFNSACLVDPKYGSHWHHKMNRPNYREFDDKRYFDRAANQTLAVLHGDSVLSQSICEDGWDTDYDTKPIEKIAAHINKLYNSQEISNLHFNLSCSPFTKGKNGARNRRFAKHSEEFDGLFYINCVGIQNNGKNVFTFDGGTTVYSRGAVLGALPPLQECIGYVQAEKQKVTLLGDNWESTQRDPDLKDVLVYGTQKFLEQCGVKKVVIGLSGGIDSALSAMIHVKAVGAQNVVLVNMPTQYNSNTTKGIAADIAKNLGCPYMVVPIGGICASLQSAITAPLKDVYVEKGGGIDIDVSHPLYNVSEQYQEDSENIAARMRGAGIQAALAAGLKAVFPNNGNKSELTVGYCTLYGDVGGYMAPLADLWKYEVYEVAKQLSDEMGGILPDIIFTLKPSAELSANHNVDEGQGDPLTYWYHDKLLASWMEPWSRRGIEGTLEDFKEGKLLLNLGLLEYAPQFIQLFPSIKAFIDDAERWWKLFNQSVFKRVQAPPVLVVSRRAYGFDFRESIGGVGYTSRYMALKEILLAKKDGV